SYAFGGSGPANYTGGTTLSVVNWWTQYFAWANKNAVAFQHTPQMLDVTYGINPAADGSKDAVTAFNTVTGYFAAQVANLGNIPGLPFTPGAVLSPPDTGGGNWTEHYTQNWGARAQNSMQAPLGGATPPGQSTPPAPPVPTTPPRVGQWATA